MFDVKSVNCLVWEVAVGCSIKKKEPEAAMHVFEHLLLVISK